MIDNKYQKLFNKAWDAKHGGHDAWGVMSTGEKVAVAIVLNRPEWLAEFGYTIAQAIDRSGPEWVALILQVARDLENEDTN